MGKYEQLIKRAKELGYELTPTLKADLRILASVSDSDIKKAHRDVVIDKLAHNFQVSRALMEARLEGWKP